ncbi:septum formation inhibitor Maf [Luteimonas sp. Sa2BVA3]|uniref:7-methyl-GTP pyrophosphatase n=1 Tax=Luteimonas colneyensis TaxID=2762230 RepID=A0ABR8UGB6_9GAMM|nr:Maf family nucleotide pyrophosphatase [Luteimonas colneyensis]MBD7987067.1 septum formation inhibitor Maf [Luteimonas colneyensis]
MPRLVLASTSRYRSELLARLRWPFDTVRPEVDETPLADETPQALALRLAVAKASTVATQRPRDCVIGSDQVADFDGRPLGKPGGREAAVAQLMAMSGRSVAFRTAVAVAVDGRVASALDTTVVRFRDLAPGEVERYVDLEQPYDCAGSFKSEGLGITLFDAIETGDPTALVGLPLIATARLLRESGLALP